MVGLFDGPFKFWHYYIIYVYNIYDTIYDHNIHMYNDLRFKIHSSIKA